MKSTRWLLHMRILRACVVGIEMTSRALAIQSATMEFSRPIIPPTSYVAPLSAETFAIERTRGMVGLFEETQPMAAKIVIPSTDITPFLSNIINGKPVWKLNLEGAKLLIGTDQGEVVMLKSCSLQVLLDPETGKLLSITSDSGISVPGLRPRPSAAWAEAQLLASNGERYIEFPGEPPNLTFVDALTIAWHEGWGNPFEAKEVEGIYVTRSIGNDEPKPVWIITLRGVQPMIAHTPPGGEDPPLWQRNCSRNVIDAKTGKVLLYTNYPTPDE
jgi:hypothetical protein